MQSDAPTRLEQLAYVTAPTKMSVDQKCYDLAEYFMDGINWRPEDKQELAEAIQQICEDMTTITDSEDA